MHPNKNKRVCKIKLERRKTYRLWTFQSVEAIQELKSKGLLEVSWDRYSNTNQFKKPYQWMAQQMTARNLNMNNNAPIWAWHSSHKYESAPTLAEARSLLSDVEIAAGIQTVVFECPAELVLLSSYGFWNKLLYDYLFDGEEAKIDQKMINQLFETRKHKFKSYDSIQATLPYLKLAWVQDIRNLNLKPNDFTFDINEFV